MAHDRKEARVAAALLAASGVVLVVSALLHPRIPADPSQQSGLVATMPAWPAIHWALTFGQIGAAFGVILVARATVGPGGAGAISSTGVVAVGSGLALGALGTLLSATALRRAAEAGDAALFAVAAQATVSVGWLGMVAASAGGAVLGAATLRRGRGRLARASGLVGGVGAAAGLVAALAVGPLHPWTHSIVLPVAAVGLGVACVAAAVEAVAGR